MLALDYGASDHTLDSLKYNTKYECAFDYDKARHVGKSEKFMRELGTKIAWDRVDGTASTYLAKFSNNTLSSMKGSLEINKRKKEEGRKYHKAYMNNYNAKMDYINWRLKQ